MAIANRRSMLGAPLRLAIRICNPPSALLGAVLRLGVRLFGKRRRSLFYRTLRFVALSAEARRGAPRPTAAPVAVAPPDAPPPPRTRCSPPVARPARSFVESMAVPHFRRFAEATAHASAAPAAPAPAAEEAAEEAVEEAAEEAAASPPAARAAAADPALAASPPAAVAAPAAKVGLDSWWQDALAGQAQFSTPPERPPLAAEAAAKAAPASPRSRGARLHAANVQRSWLEAQLEECSPEGGTRAWSEVSENTPPSFNA